jgi:hypothetical protein
LIIAQGSANETEHWLHTAQDCELGTDERIEQILKMNNEVIKMITSTIATIRANQRSRNIKEGPTEYLTDSDNVIND